MFNRKRAAAPLLKVCNLFRKEFECYFDFTAPFGNSSLLLYTDIYISSQAALMKKNDKKDPREKKLFIYLLSWLKILYYIFNKYQESEWNTVILVDGLKKKLIKLLRIFNLWTHELYRFVKISFAISTHLF